MAELQVPVLLPDGIFTGGLTINLSEIDPPIPTGSYNILFYTNDGITQPEEDSNILQEADTENNTCSHSSLPKFNITYACKDETAHNYDPTATYENNTTCRTCSDGVKNGDEQDVDCGGSCETTCPCDTHIGTFFFQDCGGILYYFIETDDGHIYDPYFPIDLPVSVTEGLRVQFNYMDNLEVSTPCDVSEKPITITCLQILEDTTPPEITCPSEINNNICAPIAAPSPLTLQDFNATDNITHADSLVFDVEQEIDHQTNFTTYTYLYSISDEAGNTSNCEVVYNIATEFMQAPDINQPSAICENEVWDQIKVGINKYRIYKDENNNPGALLSICDSPVLTCATTDLGVNTAEAGIYYFWITQFIEFLDGEICESASTPFSFTVHANPIATLTEIDKTIQTGEVLFLMDLVEDNKSGYWKGQNVLHVTDNNGNKVPYFTTNMPDVTKLNYIVNNSNCTQSYSLILTIQDNNKMLNPDTKSNLNEFKVYPNPTKGKVNVEWSKNNSLQEIIIYKINGQVIQQFDVPENGTNNIKLDLSQLSNGIYMIEIKSLYLSSMQKLLIE